MSEWKPISEIPPEGTVAILYSPFLTWTNMAGEPVSFGAIRDHAERAQIAYFKNGKWHEAGTGHEVFEHWRLDHKQSLPMYWQAFDAPVTP